MPPVEEFVPEAAEATAVPTDTTAAAEPEVKIDTSETLLTPQIVATDEVCRFFCRTSMRLMMFVGVPPGLPCDHSRR